MCVHQKINTYCLLITLWWRQHGLVVVHRICKYGGPKLKFFSLSLDGFVFSGHKFNSTVSCKQPLGQPPVGILNKGSVQFAIFVSSFILFSIYRSSAKCRDTQNHLFILFYSDTHCSKQLRKACKNFSFYTYKLSCKLLTFQALFLNNSLSTEQRNLH